MFAWYRNAACCYGYLSDISIVKKDANICKSRWFTRGWTLQKLIGPSILAFYDQDWNWLGTRHDHAERISQHTSIDLNVLRHGADLHPGKASTSHRYVSLSLFCVAQKMSWASGRRTTREEDVAYCLLGLFEVNMPLLYGEGKIAFQRLQEEIMRNTTDDSILAWGLQRHIKVSRSSSRVKKDSERVRTLLATSPNDFRTCGMLSLPDVGLTSFTQTSNGLEIRLPVIPVSRISYKSLSSYPLNDDGLAITQVEYIGVLSCSLIDAKQKSVLEPEVIGILLYGDDHISNRCFRWTYKQKEFSGSTFCLDPNILLWATITKLTICAEKWNRKYSSILLHRYSINISEELQRKTVHCVGGMWRDHRNTSEITEATTRWDEESASLALSVSEQFAHAFVVFTFVASCGVENDVTFFIIRSLSYGLTIMRRSSSCNMSEITDFCKLLMRKDGYMDPGNLFLADAEGRTFKIGFEVKRNQIYAWRLFKLNVHIEG